MIAILTYILLNSALSGSFQENLDSYLDANLNEYSNYSYEIIAVPKNEGIEDGNIALDYSRKYRLNNGYMYIPVHIQPNKKIKTNGYVTLKLKLYKNVLVSISDIDRGTELAESDYISLLKEVTKLKSEPITNYDDIKNYRAKVNISKGQILTENFFESIPEIEIGKTVTAYIKKGLVEISMDVKAKQDGYKNKIIRVISEDKKIYKAKVESSSKVLIVE